MLNKEADLFSSQHTSIQNKLKALEKKLKRGEITKQQIENLLYWRRPPKIEEFLTAPFIGSLELMLYPAWKKILVDDVFYAGSIVNELILAGSIGSGKTTAGVLGHYYNTFRVLCYRCPQLVFGVPETTKLAIVFISLYKDKSKIANLGKFKDLLDASGYFYEERRNRINLNEYKFTEEDQQIPYVAENSQTGETLYFPNGIVLYSGSTISHAISMDLIGAMLDEAEFRRGGTEEALDLYTTVKERMENRFLDRRNTLLTLISSSRGKKGVIPTYIESQDPANPRIKKYSLAVWDVKSFESYKKGSFYVLGGTKRNPSRILDKDESDRMLKDKKKVPKDCTLIQVPVVYKNHFETNLPRALRNLAGYQTIETESLVDDFSCFDNFDKTLMAEREVSASLKSSKTLFKEVEEIFEQLPGLRTYLKRVPNAPRYLHSDFAETTEAAIAMVHKELGRDGRHLVVVDFILKITSPDRIDLEKIQDFTDDLVKKGNVVLADITSDQYQSAQYLQHCIKNNLADIIVKQSVVKTLNPYLTLAGAANKNHLKVGKAKEVKKQLKAMELDDEGSLVTTKRKDMTDALAGAVYRAYENRGDEPKYYHHKLSKIKTESFEEETMPKKKKKKNKIKEVKKKTKKKEKKEKKEVKKKVKKVIKESTHKKIRTLDGEKRVKRL